MAVLLALEAILPRVFWLHGFLWPSSRSFEPSGKGVLLVAWEHDETGVRSADATEVLSRDAVFRSQVGRKLWWDRVGHAAFRGNAYV
jgi:hypothetical protein